ncbi:hypothetical protein SLEP1_g21313 [Rubroshorea leprosula]|uniref:Uncharacterized protein n=1 Tax=Rubroshorea leprosula TaxID=152421 RepID=A0AAV5J5H9_9ROSI|nr:hypothetical protein SLEP1_g21313 [Rubroshorea leprosula]
MIFPVMQSINGFIATSSERLDGWPLEHKQRITTRWTMRT